MKYLGDYSEDASISMEHNYREKGEEYLLALGDKESDEYKKLKRRLPYFGGKV